MKIQDKETFDKANVFGLGEENTAFAQYFIGNSYLNPLTDPDACGLALQTSHLSRAAATTGTSTMQRRRRTDPDLHGRKRLVSGGGERSCKPGARDCHRNSAGSKTLARSQS